MNVEVDKIDHVLIVPAWAPSRKAG
jgi:hypothetical protein